MSNTPVFPVLAVDVPYKNASQPKPTSSDMSLLNVMLTTVQQVTVRGERRDRDGYDCAWINSPRDRRIERKRAMTWFAVQPDP